MFNKPKSGELYTDRQDGTLVTVGQVIDDAWLKCEAVEYHPQSPPGCLDQVTLPLADFLYYFKKAEPCKNPSTTAPVLDYDPPKNYLTRGSRIPFKVTKYDPKSFKVYAHFADGSQWINISFILKNCYEQPTENCE